ncbi:MAG: hypothetical protein KF871_08245 [Hydrogenophaga sp.]|uniref:hypothetical protein n=1 Tax=Hydrogenophaga sp. TaxID=1904254 RepID=UPI001DD534C8|nr:hypothetical protein [Hydrogenophaga sp.]MBX3609876.1 hypothetical protein [Hydrogenophaga sp.]
MTPDEAAPRQQELASFVQFNLSRREQANARCYGLSIVFTTDTSPRVRKAVDACIAKQVAAAAGRTHSVAYENDADRSVLVGPTHRALGHMGAEIEQAFHVLGECGLGLEEAADVLVQLPELVTRIAKGFKLITLSPISAPEPMVTRLAPRAVNRLLVALVQAEKPQACCALIKQRGIRSKDLAALVVAGGANALDAWTGSRVRLDVRLKKAEARLASAARGADTPVDQRLERLPASMSLILDQVAVAKERGASIWATYQSLLEAPGKDVNPMNALLASLPPKREGLEGLVELACVLSTLDVDKAARDACRSACAQLAGDWLNACVADVPPDALPFPVGLSEVVGLVELLAQARLGEPLQDVLGDLLLMVAQWSVAEQWRQAGHEPMTLPLTEMPEATESGESADWVPLVDIVDMAVNLKKDAQLTRLLSMLDPTMAQPARQDTAKVLGILKRCVSHLQARGEGMQPLLLSTLRFAQSVRSGSGDALQRGRTIALDRYKQLLTSVSVDQFPELHACADLMARALSHRVDPTQCSDVMPQGRRIDDLMEAMSSNPQCREFLVWLGSNADLDALWTVMDVIQHGRGTASLGASFLEELSFSRGADPKSAETRALLACCFPLAMQCSLPEHGWKQFDPLFSNALIEGRPDAPLMIAALSERSIVASNMMIWARAMLFKREVATGLDRMLSTFIVAQLKSTNKLPEDTFRGLVELAFDCYRERISANPQRAVIRMAVATQLLTAVQRGIARAAWLMGEIPLPSPSNEFTTLLREVGRRIGRHVDVGNGSLEDLGQMFGALLVGLSATQDRPALMDNILDPCFNPLLRPLQAGTLQPEWEHKVFGPFVKGLGNQAQAFFKLFLARVDWTTLDADLVEVLLTALSKSAGPLLADGALNADALRHQMHARVFNPANV